MRWLTHLGGARVTIGTGLGLIAVGDREVGRGVSRGAEPYRPGRAAGGPEL